MGQRYALQVVIVAAKDPGLDRAIGYILIFHAGARLHLDQMVAIAITQQGIDPDQNALVLERGLKNRRTITRPHQLPGFLDRLPEIRLVLDVMPLPVPIVPDRDIADHVADIKRRLHRRRNFLQLFLVDLQPQALVALKHRHQSRL